MLSESGQCGIARSALDLFLVFEFFHLGYLPIIAYELCESDV